MISGSVILPDEYRLADETELSRRIISRKKQLGERLLILTHHYQRAEIVEHGDYVGDSFGLSKKAAGSQTAEHIVFCGVRFMAEAADILCRPNQKVYLPNPEAKCPMAATAPSDLIYEVWDALESKLGEGRVVPISYMNTTADLKALTGHKGGLICTSSNAAEAFLWAFERYEKLFFFPDQHLGRNTARKLGIPSEQVVLFDRQKLWENVDSERLDKARVILWSGHCYVHSRFRPEHIENWRKSDPDVIIVVHPECVEEVVDNADAVGSTSFIVDYVEKAPSGSTIAIGTELNLVHRLALRHKDKRIFELSGDSSPVCANMYRTSLADVCYCLENLGSADRVQVPPEIRTDARTALERMLEVSGNPGRRESARS
jgi:quinolinate synthase